MAPLSDLPDAELDVLAALWSRGESSTPELREALAARRPMTLGALTTLLRRLEDKGKVRRRKAPTGRGFLYRSVAARGSVLRKLFRELSGRIFGGSKTDLVSSLYETDPPTAEELDELERLVQDLRRREEESR